MLAPTHSIFGLFLTLILLAIFGVKQSLHWSILVFAILGSLFPDIDMPRSVIGRLFPFISKPLERRFGHRTITHSVIGWLATSLILSAILILLCILTKQSLAIPISLCKRWLAAFAIGYFSHLVLDMFNPRGSQLFWPNRSRDVIPKNPRFRPESGSKVEVIIFILFTVLLFSAFPISKYGITSSLRWLLGTPDAVIAEFKDMKTRLYVEFEGVFNESKSPVKGIAEVLDVKNKKLIIIFPPKKMNNDSTSNEQRIYTLSDELTADILAKKVRFKKSDEKIAVKHYSFTNEPQTDLLKKIPENALVSGVVELPKGLKVIISKEPQSGKQQIRSFETISQDGDNLILKFATREEIGNLGLNEAFELEVERNEAEINRLKFEIQETKKKIAEINDGGGLTLEGKKLMLSEKELKTQKSVSAALEIKLVELRLKLKESQLKLNHRKLVFSGSVALRGVVDKVPERN